MLQVGVVAEGEAPLVASCGVEAYEVACDVLDVLLGALLEPFPLSRAECRHAWRLAALLCLVFRHLVERVDGDVDGVAPLVDDLDHLLEGLLARSIGDGHAHESAELADAVVDVDHVVAHLELLQLLQCQCHLARACLVALQVVLVEAVEYLVVGHQTEAQVVVDESFVERLVDTFKLSLVHDLAQSLNLLLTVGQHAELIALEGVVAEGLAQQVEVLVEQRLGRDVEAERCLRGGGGAMAELDAAEVGAVGRKLRAGDDLCVALHLAHDLALLHLGGALHALGQCLGGESLLIGALDGLTCVQIILKDQHRLAWQESE